MEKISACLVVFNEEKNIKRCLESLAGAVDEIILVHDGPCHDQTLVIAADYGAKIFSRPHAGAMEFHLRSALEKATNDWVLKIDADEFLSVDLRRELTSLTTDKQVSAYEFLWPLWDGNQKITTTWPYKLSLFRKSRVSFLAIPHFTPLVQGQVKKSSLVLEHQPDYNNFSLVSFKTKWLPWARLQAQCYLRPFSDLDSYQWPSADWSLKMKLRRQFPLLLIPLEFLSTATKSWASGAWLEGLIGFKYSWLAASYRVAVNYYLFKLRK